MESGLTLMPDSENQDSIAVSFITVERNVSGSTLRNDELSHVMFGLTANEWMPGQDRDSLIDQIKCFQLSIRTLIRKEIADPFQIGERPAGITYSRHGFLAGLLA